MISEKFIKLTVLCYLLSISLNQPIYLLNNSESRSVSTIISSSTFWGVLALLAVQGYIWSSKDVIISKVDKSRAPIQKFLYGLLFISIVGNSIGIARQGLDFIGVLDGLKISLSILVGIQLTRLKFLGEIFTIKIIKLFLLIQVLFALLQYYAISKRQIIASNIILVGYDKSWWDGYAVWGTFPNSGKNTFGSMLLLSCAVLIPVYFHQLREKSAANNRNEIFTGLLLTFVVLSLILSKSRTNLFLLAVILLVEFVILYRSNFKKPLVFLTIFLISAFFAISYLSYDLLSRNLWIGRWDSLSIRFSVARAVLDSQELNYMIGTGVGSIFEHTRGTLVDNVRSGSLSLGVNTDNSFIRTFVETGIIGFLTLIISIVRYPNYVLRTQSRSPNAKVLVRSYLYLGIVFLGGMTSSDFLSNTTQMPLFTLLIGCLASYPLNAVNTVANTQKKEKIEL